MLFITCADSRIVPDLITQTEPGDLFILRNAGNLIPPHDAAPGAGEAATIEFAVAGLKVKDIVVCGHSRCGAMEALLKPEKAAQLPALRAWLAHAETTKRIVEESYRHLEGKELLTAAIQENVLVQLDNLRTHPAVAASLSRGDLRLHGWFYRLESGEVFAFHPGLGQFLRVGEVPPAGRDEWGRQSGRGRREG